MMKIQRYASAMLIGVATMCGCAATSGEQDIQQGAEEQNADYPYTDYNPEKDGPSVVGYRKVNDPLEGFNRVTFKINDISYRYLLTPLATGYKKITPDPIESSISNVFDNLYEPISLINHLLQGKWGKSWNNFVRFSTNTTLGVLGIFDFADNVMDVVPQESSLEHTMMEYNVGHGAYLVIPFIGPSSLRNGGSLIFDKLANPLNVIDDPVRRRNIILFQGFEKRKDELDKYDDIVEESEDPYSLIRDYYMSGILRDEEVYSNKNNQTNKKSNEENLNKKEQK